MGALGESCEELEAALNRIGRAVEDWRREGSVEAAVHAVLDEHGELSLANDELAAKVEALTKTVEKADYQLANHRAALYVLSLWAGMKGVARRDLARLMREAIEDPASVVTKLGQRAVEQLLEEGKAR